VRNVNDVTATPHLGLGRRHLVSVCSARRTPARFQECATTTPLGFRTAAACQDIRARTAIIDASSVKLESSRALVAVLHAVSAQKTQIQLRSPK